MVLDAPEAVLVSAQVLGGNAQAVAVSLPSRLSITTYGIFTQGREWIPIH